MIDTDKYEGHTPAPWIHDMCYENGIIMAGEERITIVQSKDLEPTLANGFDNIPHDVAVANIHLIADAPLILEAYKELRSIIDKLYAKDPCFVDSVWEEGDPQSFEIWRRRRMIDTDKYECPHCKNEYDENDIWHDVIDLQLWKTTSICEGCFEEDGGNRYKNSADIEGLLYQVKRLREEIKDYDACLQNLWDKELIPEDTDIWDEIKELLEVD